MAHEKQMGCMSGFLHIFDRNHIFTSKKLHTTKRLTSNETPKSVESIPKTIQVFSFKEGTKSSHRLSLDSNDAKGGSSQARSSTSVIAKLMGFEPTQQLENQLRRSASESRLTRDHQFINNPTQSQTPPSVFVDPIGRAKSELTPPPTSWSLAQHRKTFFEAAEVFPEHTTTSVYGEKDRKLKMRGIDDASNDLQTLKQILEAWQLKGLLHSNKQQFSHRNIVYDPSSRSRVINKSCGLNKNDVYESRVINKFDKTHRNVGLSTVSPKRERNVTSPTRARGSTSPTRSEGNVRRTNTIVKPKSLTVDTSQKVNGSTSQRRGVSSTVNSPSPRASPKRSGWDPMVANRPPRNRKKPTAEIRQKEKITTVNTEDESCSESTISTSSEIREMEEYKEGRSLLERCGKLLNSIAEMNGRDQQTSPVSVLDSSFYESESPSPILKRSIDFRDVSGELLEDDSWNQLTVTSRSRIEDNVGSEHYDDLVYISDILRSSHYLPDDSDIFSLLEKQQRFKGKDTSHVSRLHRKLIFDIINEILERNRKLPAFSSWKDCTTKGSSSLQQVWSEFLKIREHENHGDDLVDVICGVLKKDLNSSRDTMNGWGECRVELSEVVLDVERMIFRDLVSETIHDFATLASQSSDSAYRRKLVF
ncbi:hypothetical protein Leryth_010572 [Lithospermum erythrorhizon]|nr:hypothetical protein Leryth_010572 [Lithospermum erythrorhizon]